MPGMHQFQDIFENKAVRIPVMEEESPKKDANDYSRFDVSDSDDEQQTNESAATPSFASPELFHENLHKSLSLKENGNAAFKANDLAEAKKHYEEAISLLKPLKEVPEIHPEIPLEKMTEMKSTYISVLSNSCMVSFKEENWSHVIRTSNEVLVEESENVKALYRRSVAQHRIGNFEESKAGLTRVIEIDAANKAAKKELVDVIKAIKEKKQREKANLSAAFSGGGMYSDREEERQRKIRKAQEEEDRLQDEWIQDKLKRRKEGDDEEISFDDWKKKRQEAADAEKKRIEAEEKAKRKAAAAAKAPAKKPKTASTTKPSTDNDDDVYDEEDSKIISETTSKGYCYFKRQLPTEESQLIGDITPKAVSGDAVLAVAPSSAPTPIAAPSGSSGGVTASSWNHAGTWEERDFTQFAKDRLTELCKAAEVSLAGGMDTGALEDAMKSLDMPKDENPMAGIERMSAAMSTLKGSVSEAKTVDGDAQIVMARGKKRHCFDFNITLKFDIVSEDLSGDATKNKKFKGSLEIHEFTPGTDEIDGRISFKKPMSDRVQKCAESLRDEIYSRLRQFEAEYKAL